MKAIILVVVGSAGFAAAFSRPDIDSYSVREVLYCFATLHGMAWHGIAWHCSGLDSRETSETESHRSRRTVVYNRYD